MRMRSVLMLAAAAVLAAAVGCDKKSQRDDIPPVDLTEIEPADTGTSDVGPSDAVVVEPPPTGTDTGMDVGPTVPPIGTGTGGETTTYTVQKGDTLWSIADRFYGDGKRWVDIHQANRSKYANINSIPVGTVLVIPPR
jgi:nucleoid-associated protein YgaU